METFKLLLYSGLGLLSYSWFYVPLVGSFDMAVFTPWQYGLVNVGYAGGVGAFVLLSRWNKREGR